MEVTRTAMQSYSLHQFLRQGLLRGLVKQLFIRGLLCMNTNKRMRRRAVSAFRSTLLSGSVLASTALLRNHGHAVDVI